jgi:hypothetical protein
MTRRQTRRLLDEFWRAQGRIGANASAEALASWARVNPVNLEVTGPAWLSLLLLVLRGSRARSRRNAMAFYRLYRALETGFTVQLPEVGPAVVPEVSLGQLRQEWAREAQLPFSTAPGDDRVIPVEPFQWPAQRDEALDRAAAISLAATGPARVQQLVRETRGRLDDPDFLSSLESAGRNTANVADREAIRAGRELVDRASRSDRRVVGWARVTDGDPCHFCAMLASRGAIYRSSASAETTRDDSLRPDDPEALKRYHPGCHCQVVPVYSRNDFLTPEARRLSEEWKTVTRNKSGAEARRAWRQHIEGQRRTRRRSQ